MKNKLRCLAIDDEPLALELLKTYVQQIPELELVCTFDDALAAVDFLSQNAVDLVLIDIHMPEISGLELVRNLIQKPMIVFTTAHKTFAFEGFELQAIDYLLKPIAFDRFAKAIQKAVEFQTYIRDAPVPAETNEPIQYIYVYSEYRQIRIELDQIEYIESLEDYIKLYLTGIARPILTLLSLKKVLEKLPEADFCRIHRSYIVARRRVRSILRRKVTLDSGKELPIGESYLSFIEQWRNPG